MNKKVVLKRFHEQNSARSNLHEQNKFREEKKECNSLAKRKINN